MPPRGPHRLMGKNAVVTALVCRLTPNQVWKDKYGAAYKTTRALFEVVDRVAPIDASGDSHLAYSIVLKCAEFPDKTFEASSMNVKMKRPGPPNMYFSRDTSFNQNTGAGPAPTNALPPAGPLPVAVNITSSSHMLSNDDTHILDSYLVCSLLITSDLPP